MAGSGRKLWTGSLLLCVNEVGAGEITHVDPSYMERMLRVAVGAIGRLIKSDAARQ